MYGGSNGELVRLWFEGGKKHKTKTLSNVLSNAVKKVFRDVRKGMNWESRRVI